MHGDAGENDEHPWSCVALRSGSEDRRHDDGAHGAATEAKRESETAPPFEMPTENAHARNKEAGVSQAVDSAQKDNHGLKENI